VVASGALRLTCHPAQRRFQTPLAARGEVPQLPWKWNATSRRPIPVSETQLIGLCAVAKPVASGVPGRNPGPFPRRLLRPGHEQRELSSNHCRPLGVRIDQSPSTRTAAFVGAWYGVSSDGVYVSHLRAGADRILCPQSMAWCIVKGLRKLNLSHLQVPPIWQ